MFYFTNNMTESVFIISIDTIDQLNKMRLF